ncbi:TonB-dependent receptor [Brevundimonas sp. 2R-24]|uniref:TonB-dependent receptor n=1 Tax=Peiella sedimenti TaxID=3061083 RepID=A0ABT8SNK5_9CAUL|nr:TonB-dependent receptor [Caulobacteraceae bacterium XZ-24]
MKVSKLIMTGAAAPLIMASHAFAADGDQAQNTAENQPTAVQEIIVTAQPVFRNRTDDVVPTLSYDLEYFQRFEPLTVGDALRRVPSVTFLSDVIESDGARLRGLDPGYTQILINGDRVPGAGVDRSFFVDRIPAELIERVEVVRAPSARRSGDAVAGAINIVLRDAYTLEGGYLRFGGLRFDDGRVVPTFGAVWGGEVGPGGRLLLGMNVQGRRNPKSKTSWRFDEPGGTLDNIELQSDIRDGMDYSFNAAYEQPLFGGALELSGAYVLTSRDEVENSYEYQDGVLTSPNLLTYNNQVEDISSTNWSTRARWEREMFGGESRIRLTHARYNDDISSVEAESEYLRDATPFPDEDRYTVDQELTDLDDRETGLRLEHERDLAPGLSMEFGVDLTWKERETLVQEADRIRFNVPNGGPRPAVPPLTGHAPVPGGDNTIEEDRVEPYVVLAGESGRLTWEAGVRLDQSEITITDRTAGTVTETDEDIILPSASLRFQLNETDRLIVSAGRTLRRPSFNHLSPALLEEEYGDDDFIGNPNLQAETAWGVDVGVERRLGRRGVMGLNVFYRSVEDLIEDVDTGAVGSGGAGTSVFSVDNVGDGSVWGVEFDLSTPLTVLDMENTGVFLNLSWLDSEITDFAGERRFNGQSDYVLSAGFTHDIPTWNMAFGATYYQQGDAFDRVATEEVYTSYGDNLDLFVERRFGRNFVLRLTGSNLLNASKDETFHKFDSIADQLARDYDEFELESEEAGPVWQLVARYAF